MASLYVMGIFNFRRPLSINLILHNSMYFYVKNNIRIEKRNSEFWF
jgi:hypothetical protein